MKYNVCLVGCGRWGTKIYKELLVHPQVDRIRVITTDTAYSLSDVLKDESTTHILIATPVETHRDICIQALSAGRHVMCEKNTAPTVEDVRLMVGCAERNMRSLLVDFIYALNPVMGMPIIRCRTNDGIKITMKQEHGTRSEGILSVLGSHAASVLYNFADLSFTDIHEAIIGASSAHIIGSVGSTHFEFDLSTMCDPQQVNKSLYIADKVYPLDYSSGIRRMLDLFFTGNDNPDMILQVAEFLELVRKKIDDQK